MIGLHFVFILLIGLLEVNLGVTLQLVVLTQMANIWKAKVKSMFIDIQKMLFIF